mgnify:CR=1 FL=1
MDQHGIVMTKHFAYADSIEDARFRFNISLSTLETASFPVHTHDFNELVIIFGGTGLHLTDFGRQPLVAGDVANGAGVDPSTCEPVGAGEGVLRLTLGEIDLMHPRRGEKILVFHGLVAIHPDAVVGKHFFRCRVLGDDLGYGHGFGNLACRAHGIAGSPVLMPRPLFSPKRAPESTSGSTRSPRQAIIAVIRVSACNTSMPSGTVSM